MNVVTFDDVIEAGKEVAKVLRKVESSVAVSESAAGGLINAALVAVAGASIKQGVAAEQRRRVGARQQTDVAHGVARRVQGLQFHRPTDLDHIAGGEAAVRGDGPGRGSEGQGSLLGICAFNRPLPGTSSSQRIELADATVRLPDLRLHGAGLLYLRLGI